MQNTVHVAAKFRIDVTDTSTPKSEEQTREVGPSEEHMNPT